MLGKWKPPTLYNKVITMFADGRNAIFTICKAYYAQCFVSEIRHE